MNGTVLLGGVAGTLAAAALAAVAGDGNAVLGAADLDGVRLTRTAPHPWVRKLDGPAQVVTGVVQEVVRDGVQVRIQYGAFENAAAAHEAALFHMANVSASFQTGMWSRARLVAAGAETWWAGGPGGHALLIRSGAICALISCRGGDAETRDRVIQELAARITTKGKTARSVAVP